MSSETSSIFRFSAFGFRPLFLGIGDARTDKRIDFVGGVRGVMDLEQRVREGRAARSWDARNVTYTAP